MKKLLPYVSLLTVMIMYGCVHSVSNPAPTLQPEGTFSGHFEVIHQRLATIDSASANITLDIEASTGFKVSGDTTTVHEGSYGGFEVFPQNYTIYFQDHDTYAPTGVPAKVHLNGLYNYSYDGSLLEIGFIAPGDTLILKYTLKKK
jgi:hypothetical protein